MREIGWPVGAVWTRCHNRQPAINDCCNLAEKKVQHLDSALNCKGDCWLSGFVMRKLLGFVLLLFAGRWSLVGQPNYSQHVAPILQEKCQTCHRPNQIAPFSLLTYTEAKRSAEDIGRVVRERIMPPWKPVSGGPFKGNYGLTEDERQILLGWVNAGAPQGEPSLAPPAKTWPGEWQNGTPNKILEMTEAFKMERDTDQYRCFVLDPGFTRDQYLKAVEVLPGNSKIVHHVLLYLDTTNRGQQLDAEDPGAGYDCFGGPGTRLTAGSTVGAWVPGARIAPFEPGVGVMVPANAKIVMQVHYFPAGSNDPDRTKVGLFFNTEPVKKRVVTLPLVNQSFVLQPGEANKEVTAAFTMPSLIGNDVELIGVGPHMHLLGRKIRMEMKRPDWRDTRMLIDIPDWDFNWQGFYAFEKPMPVRGGTRVSLACIFDNSASNPNNPHNPLKVVRWGEGTGDEMCLGYASITVPADNLLYRLVLGL
jgi:hypothetical protein